MGLNLRKSLTIKSSLIYNPRSSPRLHLIIPSASIIPLHRQRPNSSSRKNRKEREIKIAIGRDLDFPTPTPAIVNVYGVQRNAEGREAGKVEPRLPLEPSGRDWNEVGRMGFQAGGIRVEAAKVPLFDFDFAARDDEVFGKDGMRLESRKRGTGVLGRVEEVERTKRRKIHHHHFRSSQLLFLPTSPTFSSSTSSTPGLSSSPSCTLEHGSATLLANPGIRGATTEERIHSRTHASVAAPIRRWKRSLMGPSESQFVGTGSGWTAFPILSSPPLILTQSASFILPLVSTSSSSISYQPVKNKGESRKCGESESNRLRRCVMWNSWRKSMTIAQISTTKEWNDAAVASGGSADSRLGRGGKGVESKESERGAGVSRRAVENERSERRITTDDLESFRKLIDRLLRNTNSFKRSSAPHRLSLSPLVPSHHPSTVLQPNPRPRTPSKPKIVESQFPNLVSPPPPSTIHRRSTLQHSTCGIKIIPSVISTRFNSAVG